MSRCELKTRFWELGGSVLEVDWISSQMLRPWAAATVSHQRITCRQGSIHRTCPRPMLDAETHHPINGLRQSRDTKTSSPQNLSRWAPSRSCLISYKLRLPHLAKLQMDLRLAHLGPPVTLSSQSATEHPPALFPRRKHLAFWRSCRRQQIRKLGRPPPRLKGTRSGRLC